MGRYANRIARGRFQLHGKEYSLAINNGPNCLHGGKLGFNAKVWDATQVNPHAVVMKYTSPYGEEGFSVRWSSGWPSPSPTPTNWLSSIAPRPTRRPSSTSLTMVSSPSLASPILPPRSTTSFLEVNADHYLPIDDTSIPTGEIRRVEGTPFDFRTMKPVAQDIEADDEQLRHGAGYDHCFVLNKHEEGELTLAARVKEPTSGRTMTVYTTEPGVQLYTDNWADGYQGQHGATFPRRSAICLECQHFPDSPNHPYFPSVVLNPGEEYTRKTIYQFGVEK